MVRRKPINLLRAWIPLLVIALVAAACAGDVGKYRDVRAGPNEGDASDLDVGLDDPLAADADSQQPDGSTQEGEQDAPGYSPDESPESADGSPNADATGRRSAEGSETGQPAQDAQADAPADDAASQRGDVGVTPTQIAIGLFYPKSGFYAAVTRNAPKAVQAAFNEVNEQGGIHGRQLVLKTYDDAGGDANTVAANHRRAKNEVFAYISMVSTTQEILGPMANRDGVPFLYGILEEELGRSFRYGFAAYPYLTTQSTIFPSYIINRLKARDKNIGVVFEGSRSATKAKDVFKTQAEKAGLKVVLEQPVQANQAACTSEVTNLQSRNVELVVMMHGPLAAICMLRDARTLGYKPIWTGFGAMIQGNVVAAGAGDAADGVTTLASYTTLDTKAGKHYSASMKKYYGEGMDDDVPIIPYSKAKLLLEGLRQSGSDLSREQFVEAMETKMDGFDSGYLAPPVFGPGDRSGPQSVAVSRCCTDGRWTMTDPIWRQRF